MVDSSADWGVVVFASVKSCKKSNRKPTSNCNSSINQSAPLISNDHSLGDCTTQSMMDLDQLNIESSMSLPMSPISCCKAEAVSNKHS